MWGPEATLNSPIADAIENQCARLWMRRCVAHYYWMFVCARVHFDSFHRLVNGFRAELETAIVCNHVRCAAAQSAPKIKMQMFIICRGNLYVWPIVSKFVVPFKLMTLIAAMHVHHCMCCSWKWVYSSHADAHKWKSIRKSRAHKLMYYLQMPPDRHPQCPRRLYKQLHAPASTLKWYELIGIRANEKFLFSEAQTTGGTTSSTPIHQQHCYAKLNCIRFIHWIWWCTIRVRRH